VGSTESSHNNSSDRPTSLEVAFWPVHVFVQQRIGQLDNIPMLGTPAWFALADDDPRKEAAVLDGGRHWALRLELNQEALAQASKDVAAAVDWKAVAQEWMELANFRRNNPWAKRVAS